MKTLKLFIGLVLIFCYSGTKQVSAQEGDQILDGIGETGIIARYILKEDFKDWTRNNLHADIHGSDYRFIDDELFGKVLSFPEGSKAYISLPGEVMTGEESVSICLWIYMRSPESGQCLLDFGKSSKSHLIVEPYAIENAEKLRATIMTESEKLFADAPSPGLYRWHHLALVIDAASKTFSIYINGELASESNNIRFEAGEIFDTDSDRNKLFVGKYLTDEGGYLNAKLHDLRIYRIPLKENQIIGIRNNSFRREGSSVRTRRERNPDLPEFPESNPRLYNAWLTGVEDISVETVSGHLPKLPRYLKGVYNGIEGPDVRVIWPVPEDNSQVLKPGKYTITGSVAGTDLEPKALVTVIASKEPATPGRNLEAFNLDEVLLSYDSNNNKTKFIENRDKFFNGLAATNPDNFLYMFRNTYGQEQPEGAMPLRGWDSQETKLRGHATGHYMSGIAQAYASTAYDAGLQAGFAEKMEYMVDLLYELSQMSGKPGMNESEYVSDPLAIPPGPGKADFNSDLSVEGIRTDYWNWGEGFISAYPPDQFIMLENGAKYGRDNAKVWAPYYTLHKILAGLMDIYEVSGNYKALEIVKDMGDWVYARLSKVPVPTLISMWNTYIAGEYGGMNEAMARLYRLTGEDRFLEVARLFDNIRVFYGDAEHSHGLAKNVDMFRGLHANQHIPQIMGAIEMYRDTHDPEYYHIADNFWNMATNDYMYSIGGVAGARNPSNAECFTAQPASLYENGFSAGGQNETCATYNMLKLTRNLFLYDQRAELMDYYERGLYNHILASVAEDTPGNTYHVPLRAGSVKRFGNPDMSGFTCCNGTALENSTKLQNSIYFRSADNKALYVNLYIPSVLTWSDKNITVKQTTAFPKKDHTKLTISGKGRFDLNVRVPGWATKGFFVTINGKKENVEAVPGSYLTLNRKWKDGDTVELCMPFSFRLEPVMDQQNIASLFWGPVLLAAQESETRTEWRRITLDAKDLGKSISGDPEQLIFNIDGVIYKPFYESYDRYSVYLDVTLK